MPRMNYLLPHWTDAYRWDRNNPDYVARLHARASELLAYDEKTGHFYWKVSKTQFRKAGDYAGHVHRSGYRLIKIDGRHYRAAHLAILLCQGHLPSRVWHQNGKRDDNRLANLFT